MVYRNWEMIDKHAEKASHGDAATFDKLLQYFQRVIPNDIDRDINMVRALTYWMYCYEGRAIPDDLCKDDTPLKLMSDLQKERLSYADAYETLCTKLGVKCRKVKGISKSGTYHPGDTQMAEVKEKMSATWNQVYLEGKWWPVYPRWIMKTLTSAQQRANADAKTEAGKTRGVFKEFWFLTDPELFIHKCYPDDVEDQILPKSKQVKTLKKFFRLPYLTIHFFKDNLKLMSEESCVFDSENGVGKVHFKANKIPSKALAFEYRLKIRERNSTTDITQNFDVPRLVLNSRNKGNFIFEVRCPEVADYTLEILGGNINSQQKKIYMVTKIICREKLENGLLTPLDTGAVGWGFGPYAIDAGLVKSNIHAPKIAMTPGGKKIHFELTIDEKLIRKKQYTAEMVQDGNSTNADLKDCVEATVDTAARKLSIKARVPKEGEFALVIKEADIGQTVFKPVCHFLLTTYLDEETVEDEYYDSSDGTSDIEEEIDDLRHKVEDMRRKRDELLHIKYNGKSAQ